MGSRKERGCEESLFSFLQAHHINSPRPLSLLLQEVLNTSPQVEYSETAKGYSPIRLKLVLYIIYHMLLEGAWVTFTIRVAFVNDTAEYTYKIKALMSSMIWIDIFFATKTECQVQLLQPGSQDTLQDGLLVLTTFKLARFIE